MYSQTTLEHYPYGFGSPYCQCQRCPCCGKVMRTNPIRWTSNYTSGDGIALLGGSTTIDCSAKKLEDFIS